MRSARIRDFRAAAPAALVDGGRIAFGSWEGFPGRANLLDARRPYRYPTPRFVQRLRLKEWRAIQAGDEDCFLCAVLYDAKFLSMASVDIWDRRRGEKHGLRKIFPGSRFDLPTDLSPRETRVDSGRSHLSIRVGPEEGRLRLLVDASPRGAARGSDSGPDAAGERGAAGESVFLDLGFDLSEAGASPFSVCLPFGPNRAMYSTKALMACSGTVSAGSMVHVFDPGRSLGVLDDHKGYYPYRLHYDWVTGFGFDGRGRRVGFNLTDNQVQDQVRYNENRLWLGGEILPLPPVKITRPFGRDKPWTIQDTEGMVDLVFVPEVPHDISVRLGLAEIDYSGPFGRFEGWLKAPGGEVVEARSLYGMGEDKSVRL